MKVPLPLVTGPCRGREAMLSYYDRRGRLKTVLYRHLIWSSDWNPEHGLFMARTKAAARQFAKLLGAKCE